MTMDTAQLAKGYYDTWIARDFDGFRALLAEDATFRGPMGGANNADECVEGIRGMSEHLDEIVVLKQIVDGPDAITWSELKMPDTPPVPVANWMHVEDGKITRILVTFDPRPMLK